MTDIQAQFEAVDRGLDVETRDGEDWRIQTLGQTYRASLDDVWDAVTSAERIPRWFLPISGDLRVGGRYQLEGNAGGVVEACEPPSGGVASYRVTWEFMGGAPAWLTIRLTGQAPEWTRLDLIFEGRAADVPAEVWDRFGPAATGMGWDSGLLGLALHLAGDASVTPETAQAWVQSDEGARFMRHSADAWAAVHVASGADPGAARAAADATYAMYTAAG